MNSTPYWLTRIFPLREKFDFKDWATLGGLDPYGQHQLLWKFFDLSRIESKAAIPFKYRAEIRESLPLFYVLSNVVPRDNTGKWRVEPKEFNPDLVIGDRLSFKLRVNPVVERHGGPVLDANGMPKLRKSGKEKLKVTRHDVVMDAKQRMGWKDLPPDARPSLAHLAYEAGANWLLGRAENFGCRIDANRLQVDAHHIHCLKGHWEAGNRCKGIVLSTLDFEGELEVTDVGQLMKSLYNGIGPAKAFGCGLLLVRRIR